MFITLEGIDRSGKSTQAALLADALGPQTVLLREPGGTDLGERIRELLKDPAVQMGPAPELLLFLAARSELASSVIAPARRAGRDIVCDRYIDSSVAYQGGSLDISFEEIERANAMVIGDCLPDLTILIRVAPETAAARGQARLEAGVEDGHDRFEGRGIEFQTHVANAYDELAERHPERIAVVDGDGDPAEVHQRVLAVVASRR